MPAPYPKPTHATRFIPNLLIPMSDGTRLAASAFLPDAPGPFPVVFELYPYRKDDMRAGSLRMHRTLAEYGYASLLLDVRGTGGSEGIARDEYTLQEQLDAVEAIAWMARQPWSNGNVGMFGKSYGGFNSVQVAMHRPPALKAICPQFFTDNRYTDDCHYKGGTLQMLYDVGCYGLFMVSMNALPPDPELAGERWAAMWEERLQTEPWLLTWLAHPNYDDYWKHGSLCEDYGAIEAATFIIGGWRDGYMNCNLRTFQHLRGPKKALIGPWLHVLPDIGIPGPQVDHMVEMVRFFDYWLKGVDNGVMDEPPITLYVQEYDPPDATLATASGFWQHEAGWPLTRGAAQSLWLADGGALQPASPDAATFDYAYNPTVGTTFGMFSGGAPFLVPADQRLEDAYSSNWTSAPLAEPLDIIGHAQAALRLSVTADVAHVCVRLMDVAPDGGAALVTKGVLNLAHRDSFAQPSALVPGQVYDVTVPLDATAWRFRPGHRVRVGIAGADFPNSWPSPKPYTATLHLGGEQGARLLLPAAPPQSRSLPTPQLRPPVPFAPLVDAHSERPIYRVSRDLVSGTVEVYQRISDTARVGGRVEYHHTHETTATVQEKNPARASVRGLSRMAFHWPQRTVIATSRGQIESTADAFQVTVHLDVTMDGLPHFSRRWVRSYPRGWR